MLPVQTITAFGLEEKTEIWTMADGADTYIAAEPVRMMLTSI